MTLHPRYSLLTLLVGTALVAGGVKLWYGPHHVIEPEANGWETEFTFTRAWNGTRILHGPVISRRFEGEKFANFIVSYTRQGSDCDWVFMCDIKNVYLNGRFIPQNDTKCPLSEQEFIEFQLTRDAELQRIVAAGMEFEIEYEGSQPYTFFISGGR